MGDFAVADPMEGFAGTANDNPYAPKPLLPALEERVGNELGQDSHAVVDYLTKLRETQGVQLDPGGPQGFIAHLDPSLIQPNVDVKSLQQRFPNTKFDQPVPLDVASDVAGAQDRQRRQAAAQARYPSGVVPWTLGFGADVAASLLDPVDDAALFTPLIGEGRYARWLASAGERAGVFGRLGVTAAVGTARGVAAQVPLTAIRLGQASSEGTDYSLGNAAWDTLIGGVSGGVLHTGLSFRGDVLGRRFLEHPAGVDAASSASLHDAALKTASSQMANGLPIDVEPIFSAARNRSNLMSSTRIPDTEGAARFADAHARANGAPSQDALRWTAEAQDAARTPPDKVSQSEMAEAVRAVQGMRERGELSAEDEALLASHETSVQHTAEGEPSAQENQRLGMQPMRESASGRPAVLPAVRGEGEARIAGEAGARQGEGARGGEGAAAAGARAGEGGVRGTLPNAGAAALSHLPAATADIAELRGRIPATERTRSLFDTIRAMGGIKVKSGGKDAQFAAEIRKTQQGLGAGTLIRKGGLTPDQLRESLAEQGWFGGNRDTSQTDLNDLLELIDREARGDKVYHPESPMHAALDRRKMMTEEADRAGVNKGDSHAQAAQKLAEFRAAMEADHAAWLKAADDAGIAHTADATPEDILADAIERDAIMAERAGTSEEFADRANQWIDDRLWQIAPDIADNFRNEDLDYGPAHDVNVDTGRPGSEGSGPPDDLATGGGESAVQRGEAGGTGEAGAGAGNRSEAAPRQVEGELGSVETPAERAAREGRTAIQESQQLPRANSGKEQRVADEGLFAPPKTPTMFQAIRPRELIVQHNVTAENLLHADRMGGIAAPSLAITKAKEPMTNFGEITMIGPREMADPRMGAKIFGADIYSPRYPQISYKLDAAAVKKLDTILKPYQQDDFKQRYYETSLSRADDLSNLDAFNKYAEANFKDAKGYVDRRAVAEKVLREIGAQERIFKGFTNAGNRSYTPHTLDNVLKILKKDIRGGESFNYGVGSLRAKFTPQFRSVESIRNAAHRIISKEDFAAVKKDIDEEFWGVANKLSSYSDRGKEFGFGDTVIGAMSDAPKLGLRRALDEYQIKDVPTDILQNAAEFLEKLRHLPTEYFEGKVLRGVGISEFPLAVIPDNTPQPVRDLLAKRGVETAEYKARDDADRRRVIAETSQRYADKVMFQRGEAGASTEGGERVRLSDDVVGRTLGHVSEDEARVLNEVDALARKIIPDAKVIPMRNLEGSQVAGNAHEVEGMRVTGVTYSNGARRLIAWSLESADPAATLKHEALHYLVGRGVISDGEWKALANAAKADDWIGKHDINTRYPGASPELKLEEAIAEEFGSRDTHDGRTLVGKAIARVRDFIAKLGDRMRQLFGQDATANDVFRRISSGEIGQRVPVGDEASVPGPASFQLTPEQEARQEQMDAAVAARKKLIAYQDLQKRNTLATAVDDFKKQGLSLANSIDAMTRGVNTAVKGARDSTAAEQLARQNDLLGQLAANLDKEGLMTAWRKRTLTAEWVRELFELNSKDGKPGVTNNALALKMAKAVQAAQDTARLGLNRSGAWIGDYDGYVSRTRHDAVKIFGKNGEGYPAWRDFTLERLDHDKTFSDILGDDTLSHQEKADGVEKFMNNVWQALSTGVHMASDHGVGRGKNPAFAGMGNKAKALSSERVLHWKDADSWREYQEQFADPVIERGVMNGLHRAGADTALMSRWGTNPAYTFDNLIRTMKEKYRDDPHSVLALINDEPRLRREFDILSGHGNIPSHSLTAKISSTFRAWQDIAKLGSVVLTHLSVGATKPFQLMYHGVGAWQAYSSVIRNMVQDKSPEGRATLENLHANAQGQAQDILSGYEPIDSVPGKIAALRSLSMRIGGLPFVLGRQKSGSMWELANVLGQRVGSEFDKLHPKTQRALGIYGIGKAEWDVLRNAPGHDKDGSGQTYLTPEAAQRANPADIDTLAKDRLANVGKLDPDAVDRIRAETRDKLAMKYTAYLADSADRSTITPGIPERAMFQRAGEFGPIFGQYKTWAAAAVRQMWGQAIYGSSKGEAVKALFGLVATGTALGYFVKSAKDAARGKVPMQFTLAQQVYDPALGLKAPKIDVAHDANLLLASMAQGGGMGILGDFIVGQLEDTAGTGLERAGRIISTLAGPTVSDIARVTGIAFDYLGAAMQKHPGKALANATSETVRAVIDNLPIVNAFYIRTLANYLLLDRLQNMASPGYVERYRARIRKQSGQVFYVPPGIGAH